MVPSGLLLRAVLYLKLIIEFSLRLHTAFNFSELLQLWSQQIHIFALNLIGRKNSALNLISYSQLKPSLIYLSRDTCIYMSHSFLNSSIV